MASVWADLDKVDQKMLALFHRRIGLFYFMLNSMALRVHLRRLRKLSAYDEPHDLTVILSDS
jgi:hypothetical protein